VRKTERRLPAGYEATDLGEAVVASDSRCAIVSFATAPVVVGRDNTYVLFVTDPALAAAASSFEWTFTEEGADPNVTTGERADIVYRPGSIGQLSVAVRILDGGNAELAALTLEQFVVLPSSEIEALIVDSKDKPGPGASDPDTLRELVNQHCRYYQDAAQLVTETEASPQHVVADEQLRQALAALSEDNRIDLFNIARFPKSNIFSAARILAALRDRYFSGTPFADVVTGMSGTRARWIINHFRDGPITRA
jgi:hypothetical protein